MTAVLVKKLDVQLKDGQWYPVLAIVGPLPRGGEAPLGGGTNPGFYLIAVAEGQPKLRWVQESHIIDVTFQFPQ